MAEAPGADPIAVPDGVEFEIGMPFGRNWLTPHFKIDEGANWLADVVPSSEAPGPDPMSFETKSACQRTHSRRNIAISEDVVCVCWAMEHHLMTIMRLLLGS